VIAFNQKPKNGQILITYAYLPSDGYLMIYEGDKNVSRGNKAIGKTRLCTCEGISLWVSLTNERRAAKLY
jgi:hypothetical protein